MNLRTAGQLSADILKLTGGTGISTTFADMEYAIKARDAEIIAWAEAKMLEYDKRPLGDVAALGRWNALADLVQALRDAGK